MENLIHFISNLCLSDHFRYHIYCIEGIFLLLSILRNLQSSLGMKRAAMKGLFNLASGDRTWKIRIVSELN